MKKQENIIFHKEWEQSEQTIKSAFESICEHVEASEKLKQRIDQQIQQSIPKAARQSGEEKERSNLMENNRRRKWSVKKVIIGTAAACLAVGTVCIAGSGLKMYYSNGSNIPNYTSFADLAKAETEAGYEVDAVEMFENGFAAEGIHLNDMRIENEAGQLEGKEKEISIDYKKGNENITFFARKLMESENPEQLLYGRTPDKQLQAGDVSVIFTRMTNKFVPADYELTEEDKKNMESEDFNLAYGSSEVQINQGYHVLWIENNILYTLYGTDLSISPEEMIHMAEEVIENGQ